MDLDSTSTDVNEGSCGFHQLQLSFPDQLVCLRCQAHHKHHKICLLEQAVYLFAVSGTDSLLLLPLTSGEKNISVMETFSSMISPVYKQTKGSDFHIHIANRWQTKVNLPSAQCLDPSGELQVLLAGQ